MAFSKMEGASGGTGEARKQQRAQCCDGNVGTISEFVEGGEDWIGYEERLGHFFSANGITGENKRRSILLSMCGKYL